MVRGQSYCESLSEKQTKSKKSTWGLELKTQYWKNENWERATFGSMGEKNKNHPDIFLENLL
jgi:hypothetical protein